MRTGGLPPMGTARALVGGAARLSLRGRHLLAFDAIATVTAFLLSLALRFDAPSAQFDAYVYAYAWVLPVLVACRLSAFVLLRMYQRVWRYASVDELVAILAAVGLSSIAGYTFIYAIVFSTPASALGFPRSVAIMDTVLMIAFAGAWRFALRLGRVGRAGASTTRGQRALVVGGGAAAIAVLRELRANSQLGLAPVGIVSDDLGEGQRLLGLPVLGPAADLARHIERSGAVAVLLALPSADGRTLRKLVHQAESAGARCLTVPSVAEVIAGRVTVNALREVEFEDLLRRAPSRIDLDSVAHAFRDRAVLITGGGGSIGGELARQIIRFGPRRLVLVGRGENSIFETMQSLAPLDAARAVAPVILDIRDRARLGRLFDRERPDVVFHAAAHKHVHFMEQFPEEAVATNIHGTENVLDAAVESGVGRFVFISTDKAVNPTSVMGATKRVGELLVRQVAREKGLAYATVRFGNVLSSRGSVVPVFRQQLARGGPLTVTHPDAMRYFMTIPEAVQLVLQAAVLAAPGDTFVLDMGEPVRIVQLARDLIELHGLGEDDVRLEFIGQRPGEKLVEELYFAAERPEPTSHEAIRRVRLNGAGAPDLRARIARLAAEGDSSRAQTIVAGLQDLVPEYAPAANAAVVDEDSPDREGSRSS